MSGVARPKGPLPARIYWVRRLLVLGTALALVYGIAQVLGSGSDGTDGGQKDDKATTVAGTTQPTSPSSGSSVGASKTPKAKKPSGKASKSPTAKKTQKPKKPKKTPLAQPDGPCDVKDVVITAGTDTARAGGPIPIELSITSKTSPACTFEVSQKSVVLRITSGRDKVWSSQQCTRAITTTPVVARPKKAGTALVIWSGRRSDETCSRQAAWAMPGYYHVEAAPYGGDPTDVQFRLYNPVAPTITASPKPKKKG